VGFMGSRRWASGDRSGRLTLGCSRGRLPSRSGPTARRSVVARFGWRHRGRPGRRRKSSKPDVPPRERRHAHQQQEHLTCVHRHASSVSRAHLCLRHGHLAPLLNPPRVARIARAERRDESPGSLRLVLAIPLTPASTEAAATPPTAVLPVSDKRSRAPGSAPRPLASERRRLRCLLDPRKQRRAHFPNAIVSGTASARLQSHGCASRVDHLVVTVR
jgi:hypothetical protein